MESQGSGPIVFTDAGIKGSAGIHAKQVRSAGYIAACVLMFVFSFLIVSSIMPGPFGGVVAGCITVLAFVGYLISRRVGRAERARCLALIRPSDTPGRVRCVGKVSRIARILAQEPISDTMFEPQVFRGTGALKSSGPKRAAQVIIGVVVAGSMFWAQWHFLRNMANVHMDVMLALGAAMIIGGAMFPTYLRVVPGRIDIMECGWLGKRILSVKRLDLRTKPIIVDLNRQIVQIGDAADAPKIAFGAVWDNWGFAHAALMASISTHEPAPLPDDALIG